MKARFLIRLSTLFTIILLVACLFSDIRVLAHSSLTRVVPAPDSRQEQAPNEVILEFNERLENKLYRIGVYDSKGRPVTDEHAVMSTNRRQLSLSLPPLDDGGYTVTYQLISADGHPLKASYVFTVGMATDPKLGYDSASKLHEDHDLLGNTLYWILRGLYYVTLLTLVGWTMLRVYAYRLTQYRALRYQRILFLLLSAHFIALCVLAYRDISKLEQGFKSDVVTEIVFGTGLGLSYFLSIVTVSIGFVRFLPQLNHVQMKHFRRTAIGMDAGWVLILLSVKGLNGHAMGYGTPAITVVLDVLHLLAASMWAGVLLVVALFSRRTKDGDLGLADYLPRLSQIALTAILILVSSGFVTAGLYTDGFDRLLQTSWGKLMLMKAFTVLLVIGTGYVLRKRIAQHRLSRLSTSIGIDIGLFLIIISITAIFTYLNPTASTGPLFWHEKVKGMHIAAIITPNVPGEVNQFNVSIGTGSKGPDVKKVTLTLHYLDNEDIAPIQVPLHSVDMNGGSISLYNYNFSVEGRYIQFAGKWRLEVRVLNSEDDEYVTTELFYNKQVVGGNE